MTVLVHGISGLLGRAARVELGALALRLHVGKKVREVPWAQAIVEVRPWVVPGIWAIQGAAIVVSSGRATLRIGLRDWPLSADTQSLPPQTKVDVMLESAEAERLLGSWPAIAARLPGHGPCERITVYPRRGAFMVMRMWLLTIAVVSLVSLVGGIYFAHTPLGIMVLSAVTGILVVCGLIATIRQSMRPPIPSTLEVAAGRIAVRNRAGVPTFDASLAEVALTPSIYVVRTRGGTYEITTLQLRTAKGRKLVLGVWDMRFGWACPTSRAKAPDFLVGTPDWLALMHQLGVPGGTKS